MPNKIGRKKTKHFVDGQTRYERNHYPGSLTRAPTTVTRLTLPIPLLTGLRTMAHNRKTTVANLIRQMIYHHVQAPNYDVYLGRPPMHSVRRY